MQLSAAHLAARDLAARLPALQASLALLDSSYGRARIELLDAASTLLAAAWLQDGAGAIDESTFELVLAVPIEGVISLAGTPVSARVLDATGTLWAESLTVSDDAPESTGDIKLVSTALQVGHFVRITSAVIQG